MAVIDASVYIALINAHERDHANSWAWFEQAKATQESIVAPVIRQVAGSGIWGSN